MKFIHREISYKGIEFKTKTQPETSLPQISLELSFRTRNVLVTKSTPLNTYIAGQKRKKKSLEESRKRGRRTLQ